MATENRDNAGIARLLRSGREGVRRENKTLNFKTAFTSEADKNVINTDSFEFVELDKYACYVIADGIDDHIDTIGAKLAVDTIISTFMESMLKQAIHVFDHTETAS